MNSLSLFSGAGGGLLAEKYLLNWRSIGYVEYNTYCQKVIAQRIKDGFLDEAPIFGDINGFIESGASKKYKGVVEVLTAGFPCPAYSVAGKREGKNSEKNLWKQTLAVIRDTRPKFALLENVPGLLTVNAGEMFAQILSDLAEIGFDAEWEVISAKDIGCPHLRERVWIIAYPNSGCEPDGTLNGEQRQGKLGKDVADTESSIRAGINWRQEPLERSPKPGYWPVKSILGRDLLDGVSAWMDEPDIPRVGFGIPDRSKRLKGIGNAIVPQIATLIGQAILDVEIPKH